MTLVALPTRFAVSNAYQKNVLSRLWASLPLAYQTDFLTRFWAWLSLAYQTDCLTRFGAPLPLVLGASLYRPQLVLGLFASATQALLLWNLYHEG